MQYVDDTEYVLLSRADLARRYGVTTETIRQWCKILGVKRPQKGGKFEYPDVVEMDMFFIARTYVPIQQQTYRNVVFPCGGFPDYLLEKYNGLTYWAFLTNGKHISPEQAKHAVVQSEIRRIKKPQEVQKNGYDSHQQTVGTNENGARRDYTNAGSTRYSSN